MKHTPAVKLLLKIEYEGSSVAPQYVTSNIGAGGAGGAGGGWEGNWGGAIRLDDIYGGETYDAQHELDLDSAVGEGGWVPAGPTNDASIATTVLSAQMMQPIRSMQLLQGKATTHPAPGVTVIDYGQNIAGWGM